MFNNDKKTIGVFINRAELAQQHLLCKSMINENSDGQYNIIFFSSYEVLEKRSSSEVRETVMIDFAPLENIDVVVIAIGTFAEAARMSIISALQEKYKGPVISLKEKSGGFYGILSGEDRGAGTLVRHLYSVHNAGRICFFEDNSAFRENLRRETYYLDSMEDCGLPVEESFIFRSDAGADRGEQAYEYFFNTLKERPDAVICADDNLARELTNAVIEHGFSVPGDVMVCGFNDSYESREFVPRITTVADDIKEIAHETMKMAGDLISGKPRGKKVIVPAQMHYRESCGCEVADYKDIEDYTRNHYHILDTIEESHVRQSFFSISIDGCESLDAIKSTISENMHLLGNVDEFYLCLLGQRDGDLRYFDTGLSDECTLELAFKNGKKLESESFDFSRKELVPERFSDGKPGIYYLSLLHNRDKIFGFTALNFLETTDRLDFFHSDWNMTVGLAINEFYSDMHLKALLKKNEENSITDFMTGLPNRRGLDKYIEEHWEEWKDGSYEVVFMTVDLDGLKYINDNFGHKDGDWAISAIADIIREEAGKEAIAARTGGDEFLMVLTGNEETAENVRGRITDRVALLNDTAGKDYPMGASAGFYCTRITDESSYEECLKKSDDEMYKIKEKHRKSRDYKGR
ncbi:MAG: GGDEF domain-containing protein [Lachnospiraceae bacterium]|nr:GGDEF domain-containing protein [Lachnospiraceae bacterium]